MDLELYVRLPVACMVLILVFGRDKDGVRLALTLCFVLDGLLSFHTVTQGFRGSGVGIP